jgi:hypothetical protein
MILAVANVNLRGLHAGQVAWVNPDDPVIAMYLECSYLQPLPDRTQVFPEGDSKQGAGADERSPVSGV